MLMSKFNMVVPKSVRTISSYWKAEDLVRGNMDWRCTQITQGFDLAVHVAIGRSGLSAQPVHYIVH